MQLLNHIEILVRSFKNEEIVGVSKALRGTEIGSHVHASFTNSLNPSIYNMLHTAQSLYTVLDVEFPDRSAGTVDITLRRGFPST